MGGKDSEPHYVHDVTKSVRDTVAAAVAIFVDLATSTCDSMNQTFPDDAPTTATHLNCHLPLIRRTRHVRHCPMYERIKLEYHDGMHGNSLSNVNNS